MWKEIILRKKTWLMILVVLGVKIFSSVLEAPAEGQDKIVAQLRDNLQSWKIPNLLVIMLIPFISGLVTGLAYGFVGASFPIVISLLGENALPGQLMSYAVLAYGFGYIGMMYSPVHVCFVVTNEYFKTRMTDVLWKITGPCLGVLAGAIILSRLALLFS